MAVTPDPRPAAESNPDAVHLSRIAFADPPSAQQNFAGICARLSPQLASALPALLLESPDPDAALSMLDRFLTEGPGMAGLLDRHNFLAHYALVIFGHSRYLGETLLRNPDLLQAFLRDRNLNRSLSREEFLEDLGRFRERTPQSDVSQLLARFKRRQYVRILLRDLLKIAPLAETTAEISALADVLVGAALQEAEGRLQERYGLPHAQDGEARVVDAPFTVLSMGKLGGNELNYSSDIDLVYLHGDDDCPSDAAPLDREYFIRLAQQVTDILSRVTHEGPVFRIDLRLRPQGNEGELAVGLGQALRYYAETAQDWELQALIKVRCSAGDETLARRFIRGVQPRVYTEEVNFAAIKTALQAREKMHKHRLRKAAGGAAQGIDVKLDHGGIRDVEFLVQCLQRVYGGSEPWLRSRGTLFSLQKLHDKRHLSGKEYHDLTSAYEFLRHLEHRLQLRQGAQTHCLPISGRELEILERCMEGYAPGEHRAADLVGMAQRRMAAVAEIYQRVVYQQNSLRQKEIQETPFELRSTPEASAPDQSNQQILERLSVDSPALHRLCTRSDLEPQARKNLFRFLTSAFTGSERYSAVLRYAGAVEQALALFAASDYLSDILVRHPEEISTLAGVEHSPAGARSGYLFETILSDQRAAADPVFAYLAESEASAGEKMSLLRRHYRHRVFASGARDITELRSVLTSFADTTTAAEDAVAAAYRIAGAPAGLAVMALGRLGASEFDLLSDADLLFVCDEGVDRPTLTHAAEQMMLALAAYTRDGMVFPVDARLRPRGGDGELLVTPTHLVTYFEHEAQPWEALSYTKLRFVAGAQPTAARALAATRTLFERFAGDVEFQPAVREMRLKQEAIDLEKNFKTSAGAIYDIDFLTSFLLIRHGVPEKRGGLRDRLWRCASLGLLEKADAATLDHAAELLRTADHTTRLAVGRACKWLPATEHAQLVTEKLVSEILRREFPEGLEQDLENTLHRVRSVYNKYLTQ